MKTIEDIFNFMQSIPTKVRINKPYQLYDDGMETAINNSEITKFYSEYMRKNYKKYIKNIPFPSNKMNSSMVERFDKLNKIARIFEGFSDVRMKLIQYLCLHLMDVILFDLYFDVKSRRYNVYEEVDKLEVPDRNDIAECMRFGIKMGDKDGPINLILFFTNVDDIIRLVRNYRS